MSAREGKTNVEIKLERGLPLTRFRRSAYLAAPSPTTMKGAQ
jgi:hypothetical protein